MWIKGILLLLLERKREGETARRKEKKERSRKNFLYKYMFKKELVILNHPLAGCSQQGTTTSCWRCAHNSSEDCLAALHCSNRLQYFEMSTLTNIDLKLSIMLVQNTRCVRCRNQRLNNGIFPILFNSVSVWHLDWACAVCILPVLARCTLLIYSKYNS